MSIDLNTQHNKSILLPHINHHLSHLIHDEWFDIDYWQNQNAVTGQSRGRNITWFIGHKDDEWVLRHYYRGGMLANLLKDKYLFTGYEKTRCYRELALLEQMYQQGLPVPKPVAARVSRHGLFYRADILIEKIHHARDLVQTLKDEPISEAGWHAIGALAAKFHQAGIYHSDLNAHNILIDKSFEFWLIDFDKCENRTLHKSWQEANLARLKRSFTKEKNLHKNFHFDQQNWQWLLRGYQHFFHKKIELVTD